jgi:hypothetical protein
MPSFCRHRRLEATCPVCSRKRREEERAAKAPSGSSRSAAPRRSSSGPPRRQTAGVSVRRVARAADDGYASELVMGLHATADAERLAVEIARAATLLDALRSDAPPGPLADAIRAGDPEEALWLVLLTAIVGPPPDEAAPPTWAGGELPQPGEAGPERLAETITAYRAWAARAGGQAAALAGEPSWTPERRFERAFERLALPGLGRSPRYDYLRLAGALRLADVEPSSLQVAADPRDPVVIAAKRVFGIGDAVLLERRAVDLVRACGVSLGVLELALRSWGAPEPAAGAGVPLDADVEARARAALGLPAASAEGDPGDVVAVDAEDPEAP